MVPYLAVVKTKLTGLLKAYEFDITTSTKGVITQLVFTDIADNPPRRFVLGRNLTLCSYSIRTLYA